MSVKLLQNLENGPEILRRLVVFQLFQRIAAQLAHVLEVDGGPDGGYFGQIGFVFDKAIAEALKPKQAGRFS